MTLSHRFGASLAIALVAGAGAFGALAPITHATHVAGHVAEPTKPSDPNKVSTAYDPGALERVVNWIMAKIASLFAWFLGVAAIILDYVVYYTIVKMGDFVKYISGIGIAWRVLRDIGNIALIFGFLMAGIAVIVNASFYGFGSKMLPMLLVAAIFLNFSLFISSAIIDAGNLFATEIYTQINDGKLPTPESMSGGINKSVSNEGISNRIMSVLGLATIYKTGSSAKGITESTLGGSAPWYIGFMSILLFLIASFVFLSLAFVLIARFVALLFLMIVAPLGFAGLAIPKLSGLANQWWSWLVEQTLTAPILLLLLYIALLVITDAEFLLRAGGFKSSADGAGNAWLGFLQTGAGDFSQFAAILVSFLIAMGLLLAVVIASKRMSAFGASGAMKLAGGVVGYATSAPVNLIGRGGRYMAQHVAPNSRISRAATRWAFRPMENARLDTRRIGVGAVLKAAGAGEAAAPIGKSAVGRVSQGYQYMQKSKQEADRTFQSETVLQRLQIASEQALQTGDYRQVGAILASMNDKDLDTARTARALIATPTAAALLPQNRYEKLQQSENLSDQLKTTLATARREADDPDNANSRYSTTTTFGPKLPDGTPHPHRGKTRAGALVGSMGPGERARLPGNILTIPPAPGATPGTPAAMSVPRDAILDLFDARDFDSIRTASRSNDQKLTPEQITAIGAYISRKQAEHRRRTAMGLTADPRLMRIDALASGSPAFRSYYGLP
jgi:hypothetical protein